MTSTSKNRTQRRSSARTPKSVLQRIHMEKAQEKGFQEGKKYAIRMMCAALALSLREHHNLSRDQIMQSSACLKPTAPMKFWNRPKKNAALKPISLISAMKIWRMNCFENLCFFKRS